MGRARLRGEEVGGTVGEVPATVTVVVTITAGPREAARQTSRHVYD